MKRLVFIAAVIIAALSFTSCHKNHEPEKPKAPKFDHIEFVCDYSYSQDILDLFEVEAKVTMDGTQIASEKISKTSGKFEVKNKITAGILEFNATVSPRKDKFVAGKEYDFSHKHNITIEGVNDDGSRNGHKNNSQSSTIQGASFEEKYRADFIDTFTKGLSFSRSYSISNNNGEIYIN